ncbi:hypothetical protein E3U23_01310 [Erythrobacter litoralis]|uniref:hypothetical protein n=1 Tax=Erythrobacter litoralis TaxID=39960 RepID=UPI00243586ED|nr:hypothetical protein [Erythrobacter litoralis]MDG6077836.1 hypothetical protein [Erythrobacter litoralis]
MRRLLIPTIVMALGACQGETQPPPVEEGGGAKGEVLEGTISDAMLPLDTIVVPQNASPAATPGSGDEPVPNEASADGTDAATASDEAPIAEPVSEETPEE